ncbi:MAG: hypothetical protein ABGF52_11325 [Candidatus Asgardarchaeum sp.]
MAATELARGRNITVRPVPIEITYFLLAKEFGWLPSQCQKESSKDLKGITHILSAYNKIKNQEIERMNKQSKKRR